MSLIALIAIATVTYTAFSIALARGSSGVSQYLGVFVYQGLGAVIALVAHFIVKGAKTEKLLTTTPSGLAWTALAGVLVAVFSVAMLKIFARGGLAYVMPLVYGGTVVLSVLAARVFFKETVSGLQAAGILMITAGIALVVYAKMAVPIR